MLKRMFDICFAILALLILAPAMVLIAIIILVTMGRPICFRQQRPGLHGITFYLVKFRTMQVESAEKITDEDRLTNVGAILRSTSLDELPELWNILLGEMSFVGPRPLLMEYLPLYNAQQSRRHDVKPGLTGWAQINGRNAISWDERFNLDIWYVENRSLLLDFKILVLTIWKVLKREGINADAQTTMAKFTGND